MSVVAWLFGLGAAAVVFPVLFHLIRRTPQGQTPFSSLMFLKPSPPRLTRRSRLDNWLLLLLRALAICLLAFAFMRPYFPGAESLAEFDVEHRRVAILLDVSASMRRGDVWPRAIEQVNEVLGQLEANDEVALLAFDRQAWAVVPFSAAGAEQPGQQQAAIQSIKDELKTLQPGWSEANLGNAMVAVANQLDDWHDQTRSDDEGRRPKLQLVVISDLQAESGTEALQAYQWPPLIRVSFRNVAPQNTSNATVERLAAVQEEIPPQVRVRVSNAEDSLKENFKVDWPLPADATVSDSDGRQLSFIVPPGTSRVLKVPLDRTLGSDEFRLAGDNEDFDNVFFVSAPQQRVLKLAFVGDDDPEDPESLLFYVQRAFTDSPTRKIEVVQVRPSDLNEVAWLDDDYAGQIPALLIVASPLDRDGVEFARAFAERGRQVLAVVASPEIAQALNPLVGATAVETGSTDKYRILGQVDYRDPVFFPFVQSAFADFTSIRFWKTQPVQLADDTKLLASFDNRQPAVWARDVGDDGRVIGLAAGWRPSESQLALSPKFVVLLSHLLELGAGLPELDTSLVVGDAIEFPAESNDRKLVKPNGSIETIESGQTRFARTTVPGIYRLQPSLADGRTDQEVIKFAVNIDRRESVGGQLEIDQLERLGVQVGEHSTAETELAQLRELRDREIESRQKVWKWLIVAALVVLISETWLAGRKSAMLAGGLTG